jgi:branched-chain amino acid transport system ATP-binding protein
LADPILSVEEISVYYGAAQAINTLSFELARGEMLALIGANGAGKTTLFKAITGLVPRRRGDIRFNRRSLMGMAPGRITAEGIAMVPEGRRLFRSLSVEENLILGGHVGRKGPWSLDKVYSVFPVLKEKRHQPGTSLSGGQQQMVAIGRALMSNPDILLLDEVSLGLAPVVIKDIYAMLPQILGEGLATILVEQDVSRALKVSQRCLCMLEGRISLSGPSDSFTKAEISAAYFGT